MTHKSLVSNALYNIIYKSLNLIFPLITIVYVSRILLPVGVGKVAAAQNIVQYFVVLAALGLPTYGVKKIAEYADNRALRDIVFSELFIINAISTFVLSLIYLLMIYAIPYFHNKSAITLVVGIQLFANIINIDWFYQGLEEYKYIMRRSIIVKILSLASVFLFVKSTNDFIIYALITTLSLVLNYVFNIIHCHRYAKLHFNHLNIKQHIKPLFILLSTTIAIEVYTLVDTTMLNFYSGNEIVGIYTNATKSCSIVRMLIVALCAVFLPRLNYYYTHNYYDKFKDLISKGIMLLVNLSLPMAMCLFIMADNCVLLLFGDSFIPAITTLRILSLSIVTVSLSNFMGYQILVTINKEKFVLYSTIIGAVVNIILNAILIPNYAQNGAAIASVISEGAVAIYQFYYVTQYVYTRITFDKVISLVIPLICMLAMILLTKYLCTNIMLETILSVVIGVATFFIVGLFCKNSLIIMATGKIKSLKNR